MTRKPDPAPLPYDGVLTVTIGTGVWLVALVVMLPFWSHLRRDGHLWWIATAACGFGLGLLGIVYCRRRATRLRSLGPQRRRVAQGSADSRLGDRSTSTSDSARSAASGSSVSIASSSNGTGCG